MRKHTFRLWDQRDKKMIYPATDEKYSFHLFGDGSFELATEEFIAGKMRWHDRDSKDFVIMENTGLKDTTGKDIWEGDLVVYPEHYSGDNRVKVGIAPVLWYKDSACFDVEGIDFATVLVNGGVRVVGNTCEGNLPKSPTPERVMECLSGWYLSQYHNRAADDAAVYKYLHHLVECSVAAKDAKK